MKLIDRYRLTVAAEINFKPATFNFMIWLTKQTNGLTCNKGNT